MTSTTTDRRLGVNAGQAIKVPVLVATTGSNITLSGEQTIDGVLTSASRVLVKDQTDATTNGIYNTSSGTWTRAVDFDGNYDVVGGTLIEIFSGTINGNSYVRLTNSGTITIGTTALTFGATFTSAASTIYYTPVGTGVTRTLQDERRERVSVSEWMTAAQIASVKANTGVDVTAAVAAALTYIEGVREGTLDFLPFGDYYVSQITLASNGMGTTYNFHGSVITGNATSSKTSVLEIKCNSAWINNLVVSQNFNANYPCAVQWYTNDATKAVNYNHIDGLWTANAGIGLVIGALPSQGWASDDPAHQSAQAQGVAVDSPVSESYVAGLRNTNCVKGVYVAQSNCKLTLTSPMIEGKYNASWGGTYSDSDCVALHMNHPGSEITVSGGEVIRNAATGGKYVWVQDGHIEIVGPALESTAPFCIGGGTYLSTTRVTQIQDWGISDASTCFFAIMDSATGSLTVSDTSLQRSIAYAGGAPYVKVVSEMATFGGSVNPSFWVNFTNVEFDDPDWPNAVTPNAKNNAPVIGCRSRFINCWMNTRSSSSPYAVTATYRLDEGPNLLSGVIDLSFKEVTAYAATQADATLADWSFTHGGSTNGDWGMSTSNLPTITGETIGNVLRLGPGTSTNTYTMAETAPFSVEPNRTYLIKGYIRPVANGARMYVYMEWYRFSGAASSTAETIVFDGPNTLWGTTLVWSPFMLLVQAPADACLGALRVRVDITCDIQLARLEIR